MADDYSLDDKAQLLAEGLGISPSSYGGEVQDAYAAMVLLAGYKRMGQGDRDTTLRLIHDRFAQSSPAFWFQCQGAAALIVANPIWVPAGLSNDELEKEIKFWRPIVSVMDALKWPTIGGYVTAQTNGLFKAIWADVASAKPVGLGGVIRSRMAGIKPAAAGPMVFMAGASTVAHSSLDDFEAEAKRRGQLGSMSKLTAERFGPQAH